MYKTPYIIKRYCDGDITQIEGYDEAMNSPVRYQLVHRLMYWDAYGQRRKEHVKQKVMIALGLFWKRPPEELKFITYAERKRVEHNYKGTRENRYFSNEYRRGQRDGAKRSFIRKQQDERTERED